MLTKRARSRLGIAAVATGGAHALSYPYAGWALLALVAYLPMMLVLWRDRPTPKHAFFAGLLAGAVLHGVGHYWIAFTAQKMSGMPAPLAWLVVLVYALAMGLHQALWAWSCALLREAFWGDEEVPPLAWVVAVASLLAVVEFVVPYQFPWYLGNALYTVPIFMQVADLAGIWLVTLLCGLVSGGLAVVWLAGTGRHRVRAVGLVVALLLAWLSYGGWRMAAIDAKAPTRTITVAMIQPNPTIGEKTSLKPKPRIPMQSRAEKLTRAVLAKEGAGQIDVVVWPEGSLPFYYVHKELPPLTDHETKTRAPPVVKHTTFRAHKFAKTIGKPLLIGSLRRTDRSWKAKAHNSAVLLDGSVGSGVMPQAIYDKRQLVPFGEYLPGSTLIPALARAIPGVSDLGPGTHSSIMEIAGAKFGVSICYEALFAGFMLDNSAPADVLVNLTDDLWFGPTNAPELHVMVQYPRAVELRRPLLRATATGVSGHIDAAGRVRSRTGVWTEATLVERAEIRDLDSVFRHFGLWPMRGLALGCAVLLVGAWRRRA